MEAEILKFANMLIDHFGSGRIDAYFDCFSTDATFIFHNHPERLSGRAAYEALFETWRREADFRVIGCRSTNQKVQVAGEVGVFLHDVETRVSFEGAESVLHERETIVFQRQTDGRWLAIHEHLSPNPAGTSA